MSSHEQQLQVGAKVGIKSRPGERGTIKYRGEIRGKPGLFFGIALNKATGKNDGTLDGEEYFRCSPNHGTFVRAPNLKLVTPAPSHADRYDLYIPISPRCSEMVNRANV
jgi:dynactin complex subunit